jgi:hypothetical protein
VHNSTGVVIISVLIVPGLAPGKNSADGVLRKMFGPKEVDEEDVWT